MAIVAMHSAATGLRALSMQLDVISNNIANANNNGFKASRANFEDLLYQYAQEPGTQDANNDVAPIGVATGYGVRVAGTELDLTQGSAIQTGNPYDMMIQGNGFFRVKVPNGFAYTRTGSFSVNANGNLVTGTGYLLDPPIVIPQNATNVTITSDGQVQSTIPSSTTPTLQQIQMALFPNPQGLLQDGGNLYSQTQASGPPQMVNPGGQEGAGQLQQGFLETSNVDPVNELVDLIKTQRTFELNSQTIQAADQMLQQISNLRH